MRAASVIVFAVDDLGLLRMKFQAAFRESLAYRRKKRFRFLLAASMHDSIIGVACELNRAGSYAAAIHRTHNA
jgi:hypothetical protein